MLSFNLAMLEKIEQWLSKDDLSMTTIQRDGVNIASCFLRIPCGASVEAIYGGDLDFCASGRAFVSDEKLDRVGFFCKHNGVFYLEHPISVDSDHIDRVLDLISAIRFEVMADVQQWIEAHIDRLKEELPEAVRAEFLKRYERAIETYSHKKYFCGSVENCANLPSLEISTAIVVDYLNDSGATLDRLADEYQSQHRGEICRYLLLEDALSEAFAEFSSNPPQKAILIKEILTAITTIDAVKVNVTITNDKGDEMTVPYPVHSLNRYPVGHFDTFNYSGYRLTSRQRAAVKEFFSFNEGRPKYSDGDIFPEDIKRITYKRKVIYERKGV